MLLTRLTRENQVVGLITWEDCGSGRWSPNSISGCWYGTCLSPEGDGYEFVCQYKYWPEDKELPPFKRGEERL